VESCIQTHRNEKPNLSGAQFKKERDKLRSENYTHGIIVKEERGVALRNKKSIRKTSQETDVYASQIRRGEKLRELTREKTEKAGRSQRKE